MGRKKHWDQAYAAHRSEDLSWYQLKPEQSLALIKRAGIDFGEPIIDVGGGTSRLVDHLLHQGYQDLTVLDISATALQRSRHRLGKKARRVKWIEANIVRFSVAQTYGLWHDRAVFHFLTRAKHRKRYIQAMRHALGVGGQALIATFALDGPEKCSGLEIVRYDATRLTRELGADFQLLDQERETHRTPAGKIQRFDYFRLIRK